MVAFVFFIATCSAQEVRVVFDDRSGDDTRQFKDIAVMKKETEKYIGG